VSREDHNSFWLDLLRDFAPDGLQDGVDAAWAIVSSGKLGVCAVMYKDSYACLVLYCTSGWGVLVLIVRVRSDREDLRRHG